MHRWLVLARVSGGLWAGSQGALGGVSGGLWAGSQGALGGAGQALPTAGLFILLCVLPEQSAWPAQPSTLRTLEPHVLDHKGQGGSEQVARPERGPPWPPCPRLLWPAALHLSPTLVSCPMRQTQRRLSTPPCLPLPWMTP